MPVWKLKSPNCFLAHWHSAMLEGEGERPLAYELTEAAAKSYANKFRAFRHCLRTYPAFAAANVERDFNCKIKLRAVEGRLDRFDVWLIVKPRTDFGILRKALGLKD